MLKNKIFPELKGYFPKGVRIWSAACASGEEIYSLYLLAAFLGIDAEYTASDINSAVLEKCRNGLYSGRSLRSGDGACFANLTEPYKKKDGSILMDDKIRKKINVRQINLFDATDFPISQSLIFLRNVFIYFDVQTKRKILAKITEKSLADGGYLFVSMNEVASLDSSVIPRGLCKLNDGKVFYFKKISSGGEK